MADKPKLTFAAIKAFKLGELGAGIGQSVTLEKRATKSREQLKSELPEFGKYYAALDIRYTELLNANEIPKNVAKTDWIEQNAGGKIPTGVFQAGNVFTSLVLTVDANGKPLFAEENYDNAKGEWLRDCSAIINHCKEIAKEAAKAGSAMDWRGMDDVLDALNALSKAGDAGKKLKEIRKRQKGGDEAAEKETAAAAVLTVAMAVAFLASKFSNADKENEANQAELCNALWEITDAWAANSMSEEQRNALDKQIQTAREKGIAPTIAVTAGAALPGETPAAKAPETPATENKADAEPALAGAAS